MSLTTTDQSRGPYPKPEVSNNPDSISAGADHAAASTAGGGGVPLIYFCLPDASRCRWASSSVRILRAEMLRNSHGRYCVGVLRAFGTVSRPGEVVLD